MSRLSRARGKNFELAIARYLNCKRNHFEAEDLRHPTLSIECKHRKKLPTLVEKAMVQSEKAAEGDKLPIVVMHGERQKYDDCLVVMRLKDFKERFLECTSTISV